jgi:glycosyltransferase involved in cell wall biosynthesis
LKILVAYAKFNPHGKAGSDVYLLGMCHELASLGHEVTVATTASANFVPKEAFSLKWFNDYDTKLDGDIGFRILRFPIARQIPDLLREPVARYIMRQWEAEDYRQAALLSHSSRFPEFTLRQVDSRSSLPDRLHAYTIGPNSPALRNYLFDHARDYDCIIAGYFPFNTVRLASLAAKKAGRPCYIAPLWHSEDRHHYFKHLFEALKDCTGIICETRHAKELFERCVPGSSCLQAGIGVSQRHIFMPDGDMPSWLRTLREQKRQILLYVGRKEESKNYTLLLEMMRRLDTMPVTLVMIGRDIDHKPIEQPNVLLLEQINDNELQWAYRLCDIFLFPSLKESFGIVILEAWAAEKPVIGHGRCAAVSSLIAHKVNGMLCESVEEWTAAIKLLLDDPRLSRSLGAKGRDTVLSQYTWKIVGQKVSDFIGTRSRNFDPAPQTGQVRVSS